MISILNGRDDGDAILTAITLTFISNGRSYDWPSDGIDNDHDEFRLTSNNIDDDRGWRNG